MEEKKNESPKERNISPGLDRWYKIGRLIVVMLLVLALGLYSINKVIDYRYKVVFIKSPCHLCAELHPNQTQCINGCFTYKLNLFPDGKGGWSYENGTPYQGYTGGLGLSSLSNFSINLQPQ